MSSGWIEVKVITCSDSIEPVTGIFYGLNVKGVAIEDPKDILERKQDALSWDFADVNILEYGDKAAVVKGYFTETDDIDEIVVHIKNKLAEINELGIDIGEGKVLCTKVFEEDWSTSWKKYYKTVKLGKNIVIKPTWEEYKGSEGELILELDPGMAFGTGTHETTIMCIELLEKNIKKGHTVFDIGTGSGILAIAASKLGAEHVLGVDLDEVAVKAAAENVAENNLTNVEIKYGNLTDVIEGRADIIVANIIADIIIGLTETVKPFINDDGLFIASGIISDRKDDVLEAFSRNAFRIIEVKEMGEWVAIAAALK